MINGLYKYFGKAGDQAPLHISVSNISRGTTKNVYYYIRIREKYKKKYSKRLSKSEVQNCSRFKSVANVHFLVGGA